MLICCICYSLQIFSNNGIEIHSSEQRSFFVLDQRIVKTMHCYEKCLTVALVLVFVLFLTIAFKCNIHYKVFLTFSAKELL